MFSSRAKRGAAVISVIAGTAYGTFTLFKIVQIRQINDEIICEDREKYPGLLKNLPGRAAQLRALRETLEYDVVVIGGGCMGSGIALDAVTRGLKTALVEADDFASGASSRSTKMVHGGAQNLQKAVMGLKWEEFKRMREAMTERAHIHNAVPHLFHALPVLIPIYKWWQMPYIFAGVKFHDILSGRKCLKSSSFVFKKRVMELLPLLQKRNIFGGVVHYDGQQEDARVNIAVVLTAARFGANVANYVRCTELVKAENGSERKVTGVRLKDMLTGEEWAVKTKCVINATGHMVDSVRRMDDPTVTPTILKFIGVHLVLPSSFTPAGVAMADPAAPKGHTVMFVPWQKSTLAIVRAAGPPEKDPVDPNPNDKSVQWILEEINSYLGGDETVKPSDVKAAFGGVVAVVANFKKEHDIQVSDSNLITVAGGHWGIYRAVAQETVDAAVKACGLASINFTCKTLGLVLEGGHNWSMKTERDLVRDFGLPQEVAQHLSKTYGDRAVDIARTLAQTGGKFRVKRIHDSYPFLEEEVAFAVREEYALTPVDFLARRTCLAFIDAEAALETLPRVVELMGKELKWTKSVAKEQLRLSYEIIQKEMGYSSTLRAANQSGR